LRLQPPQQQQQQILQNDQHQQPPQNLNKIGGGTVNNNDQQSVIRVDLTQLLQPKKEPDTMVYNFFSVVCMRGLREGWV